MEKRLRKKKKKNDPDPPKPRGSTLGRGTQLWSFPQKGGGGGN